MSAVERMVSRHVGDRPTLELVLDSLPDRSHDRLIVSRKLAFRGNSGLFVAMPSRKRPDGQHQDLAHPINDVTRKYLTEKVMAEYERELAHPTAHPHSNNEEQHAYRNEQAEDDEQFRPLKVILSLCGGPVARAGLHVHHPSQP